MKKIFAEGILYTNNKNITLYQSPPAHSMFKKEKENSKLICFAKYLKTILCALD